MLYSKGKAVQMFAPLEREIEEASAIAFQIKASDLSEEVKEKTKGVFAKVKDAFTSDKK